MHQLLPVSPDRKSIVKAAGECVCVTSLTVTVKKLQPVMNPVIGLLSGRLLNRHTTNTQLLIEIFGN